MNRLTASCILFAAFGGVVACSPNNKMVEIRPVQTNPVSEGRSALKGRELFSRGQYALALESFRRVVREAPDAPEGYNGLAACYDMMGRFDVSEKYYQMALARAPMDGRIYRNMARSLDMQGRKGEGAALLAEWQAIEAGKMVVAAMPHAAPAPIVAEVAPLAAATPVAAEIATPVETTTVEAAPVEAMAAPMAVATPAPAPAASQTPTSALMVLAEATPVSGAVANAAPIHIPTFLAPIGAPEHVAAPVQSVVPMQVTEVPRPSKPIKVVTAQPQFLAALAMPAHQAAPVKVAPVKTVAVAKPVPAPKPVVVAALAPLRSLATKPSLQQPVKQSGKAAAKPLASQVAVQAVKQPGRPSIRLINAAGQTGLARWAQQQLALSGINQTQTANATRRYRLSWVVYPRGQRDRALAVQKSLPFPTRILQESRASRIVVVLGANARGMQTAALKTRRG